MGTHVHYTHGQACQLLNIDGKTLNRWLDMAEIDMQPDPKDTRIKRITRTQLQRLASLHQMTLPEDDDILREDVEQAKSLSTLTWEVEQLGQLVENLQGHLEQMLRTHLQTLCTQMSTQILAGISDLLMQQATQVPQLSEQITQLFHEHQKAMLQALDEYMKREQQETVTQQPRRVDPSFLTLPAASSTAALSPLLAKEGAEERASAEIQQARPVAKDTETVGPSGPTVKRFERPSNRAHLSSEQQDLHMWSEEELFEEEWFDADEGHLVSRARMGKAHTIPDTNLRRDIEERHVLTMVNKRLLYKGSWKTGGFTAAQRRRVWEEYHLMSWFNPCEICKRNQHMEESPDPIARSEGLVPDSFDAPTQESRQ